MERLSEIPEAQAFVRIANGVYKQVSVFARGSRVFVPHSGGYVRVCYNLGSDGWATSHPTIRVLDITQNIPGLVLNGEPTYNPTETST